MPPTRRNSRATTPPARRPRVAGLRRPGSPQRPESDPVESTAPDAGQPGPAEQPLVAGSVIGDAEPPADFDFDHDDDHPDHDHPDHDYLDTTGTGQVVFNDGEDAGEEDEPEAGAEPAATVRSRPAGKRRDHGITQPDDLARAEAGASADEPPPPRRRSSPLAVAVTLVVVALLLAGLAVWFRGEANSRSEGADMNNSALTDPGTASEAVQQLRGALEKVLSYNYTDLDSTAKAAKDNLAGKAPCEYDKLFGEVRKLAPEQKIVVSAQVRDIGLVRLEGDRAVLLAFVDQRSTRTDQNQTAVSGAQFNITAERQDGRWKITGFDLLGQPLANGQAAPQC